MAHVRGSHEIEECSVRNGLWRAHNFRPYDAVLHVAAVVHQPSQQDRDYTLKVNRDLPVAVCLRAAEHGVRQFIFMSTMAVYGMAPSRQGTGTITPVSACQPTTIYGESKWAAEEALRELVLSCPLNLSIIRPPMVYGPACPGNYFRRLLWMGQHLPVFPTIRENRLSMLGIRNLCELITLIVENRSSGIYCPDDRDGFGTRQRLNCIAEAFNRRCYMSALLGRPLQHLPLRQMDSLYGDLYYDDTFDHFGGRYVVQPFAETIREIRRTKSQAKGS